MKINKLEKDGNWVTLEVEVDVDTVKQTREQIIDETNKEAKLPGFRPGKTPRSVLEKRLGKEYFHEKTLDKVLNNSYFQAIQEKQLEPVDYPTGLKIIQNEEDKPLVYSLKVEVRPEVNLSAELVKKIKVEVKREGVDEEAVQKVLASLQERLVSYGPVTDRPVETSDLVKVEMRATSNGEAVPEWTMESAGVRIGDGLILKEFDEQLIGMKMGEEKNFSLEFPGQYPLPKVAGKKLDFQVKIKEIMGPKKPVLDDELAKKAGPFQTLEALKQQVKTDLEKKAAETNRYLTGQEVIKKLAEAVGLVVPEAMIRRRVEFLKNNFEADLGRSAVKLAEYLKYLGKSEADFLEDFKKQALVELRTELILTEVARFEKMVVTQEEIAQEINLMALDSGQDPVQLNQGLDEKNINDIKNYIILKKSTDYLVGNAEVKYVD